tara:strand:- start:426 stop:899 length:474 start_codon:yes stop_codon:yes gene_type:complete
MAIELLENDIPKILLEDDPLLRKKSERVTDFDPIPELFEQMKKAMYNANGIGLAAPQIGVLKQVIIVDETTEEHGQYAHCMVNPKITAAFGNDIIMEEGCLSCPDKLIEVLRNKGIRLTFQDQNGFYKKWKLDGMASRVVQHEMDHLNGILMTDYQV